MSEDTQRFDIQVRNAEPDEGETPDWETIRRDLSPEKTVDEIASMTREDIMEGMTGTLAYRVVESAQ